MLTLSSTFTIRLRLPWLIVMLLCGMAGASRVVAVPSLAPGTPVPDMRILIDVSGSMRETDPENLRIPALNLLVDLVPDGSHAGVWTFGTDASPLVPLARVNEGWRGTARRLSGEIGSEARYTDIAQALEAADEAWLDPGVNPARMIVLLTDGKVDISETVADSASSREAILARLAPRLRAAGVRVYTIALSDDADLDLLSRLSLATDGFSSLARSADDLLEVFLSIFTRAVEQEALQIRGQAFHVDASISEFTALVFRPSNASDMVLHAPDGLSMRRFDHPDNVRWRDAERYNMVTVSNPRAGDWLLEADLQPGTRVNIITALRMRVEGLPGNLVLGERPTLRAWLEQDGERVTDAEFLDLFDFAVQLHADGKAGVVRDMVRVDGEAGVFETTFAGLDAAGEYEVRVRADGGTITREKVLPVRVVGDLFAVTVEGPEPGTDRATLRVTPERGFVVLADTRVEARALRPDGSSLGVKGEFVAVDGAWRVDVPLPQPGVHEVSLRISSRSVHGRDIVVHQGPFSFGEPVAQPTPAPPSPVVTSPQPPAPAATEDRPSLLRLVLVMGLLGVFGGAGLALVLRKRRAGQAAAESAPAGAEADPAVEAGPVEDPDGDEIELSAPAELVKKAAKELGLPEPPARAGTPVGPAYEGRAEEVAEEPPGPDARSASDDGEDKKDEDGDSPPRQ